MDENSLSAVGDLMPDTNDHYQLRTQYWFLKKKDYNDKRDPPEVFDVLNATLKESLERLKMMRSAFFFLKEQFFFSFPFSFSKI